MRVLNVSLPSRPSARHKSAVTTLRRSSSILSVINRDGSVVIMAWFSIFGCPFASYYTFFFILTPNVFAIVVCANE